MWVSFQYAVVFITFFITIISLSGLVHYAIDALIPAKGFLSSIVRNASSGAVLLKIYVSALLVTFPVFCYFFLSAERKVKQAPHLRQLRTRKSLVYIGLSTTSIVTLVELIRSVYAIIDSSITVNSAAHIGANLLISLVLSLYLMSELWSDRN